MTTGLAIFHICYGVYAATNYMKSMYSEVDDPKGNRKIPRYKQLIAYALS